MSNERLGTTVTVSGNGTTAKARLYALQLPGTTTWLATGSTYQHSGPMELHVKSKSLASFATRANRARATVSLKISIPYEDRRSRVEAFEWTCDGQFVGKKRNGALLFYPTTRSTQRSLP